MENPNPLNSPELKKVIDKYSPFLIEARKRVFIILSVFAVATIGGFFLYEKIIKLLINLFSLKGVNIVFTSPFQFINLAITTGISCGVIASFPLIVIQVLSFLRPALKRKEFKTITSLLPLSFILFIAGFTLGALIMKWQIEIFLDKSILLGIGNILDISNLLTTVLLTSTLMGVGFQFPIVLLLLMRLQIVSRNKLASYRLWVYLGSFVFAILLPPDSILADVLLSLPLIVLFELTLLLGNFSKDNTPNFA